MQNTSQTFRGSATPGGNYSDHSYDNNLVGHCQSSGYQPYPSQVYHPRPHHYGNHQVQQNMSYRQHGGGVYAPNQNQYGSNMNQDMYRNHHPNYAGNNNRNIPPKPWTESNSSSDLMPPYGQVSPHSQMMNNPSQIPVNAMRSPPHAASSMNPSPQGQQHFRPMQSPGHSPHSWSQAQIPSPGMMHSRTSPLPAHIRSPGHNQPFSPPSAHTMNLQSHLPPQENGQITQPIGGPGGNDNRNSGNPLHSLQKMVLLDQDPKGMMTLSGDGSEQFPNQCGPHNYGSEECNQNEPKDPQYSTYYNMDENRFESKPNSDDASVYAPVQMTNSNYPVPPHPENECDAKITARVPSSINSNIAAIYHSNSNQNSIPPPQMSSVVEQSQCKSNIPQNDCSVKQNECPPHAESAPVFTDQTEAAVSTNSEQALEYKSNNNWVSDASDPEKASVAQVCNSDVANTPHSSTSQIPESSNHSVVENSVKISENSVVNNKSSKDHDSYTLKDSEANSEKVQETTHPSIGTPSSESQDCDSNITSTDSKSSNCEDSQGSEKVTLRRRKVAVSYEEALSPETENKVKSHQDNWSLEKKNSNQKDAELNLSHRNPVKVVIHRIRKSDANDTWHVPGNTSNTVEVGDQIENEVDKVSESKTSHAPQIIMLSQAVSEKMSQKSSNSVISTDVNQTANKDISSPITVKEEPTSPEKDSRSLSIDRKRPGRPIGSRNKTKSNNGGKNKRGKKGGKKRKNDNSKQKINDSATKIKKVNKNFCGPFVRITGNKENPSSISVVNVAQKEEEKLSKTLTKRSVSSAVNRIKSKTVGHLSTLSPTYDAYNRDKTWVCVFCQKGSHHGGLGDLYGPYYIKDTTDDKSSSSSNLGTSAPRNKRKKSETDDSKTPKRSKQASTHSTPASRPHKTDNADSGEPMKEVWIHEDCAVWCQSITLIGEEVRGLDEAVTEANENKCSQCSFHGATLGCWGKSCKEMYHYTCAKAIGCQLDIEKFSVLCMKHQKKSPEGQSKCQ